ncbi:SdpI family protein [Microlunatus soli]|uniref:SdpI/YhfL protein family protein n=1 Tax=Microlunatus soli TaxID=630515 RepID=A0A1H1RYD5_9ACTN|nr:SdpI family protein [Microlunatus soli]SDS40710.1 SdpI/YhfL protein family protein [Microlunatus soli]
MTGPGIGPAIFTAVLLAVAMVGLVAISRLLGNGTIGQGAMIGFRLPPLLRSDEAWLRGHRAAVLPMTVAGAIGILALIASVLLSGTVLPYLVALGTAIVALVAGIVVATVRAVRAAAEVNS